uniref:Chloride channel accessory 1 n=1 Tax=Cyprinus carpio carpio TaxID=630221 RepID=A0A8C1D8A1_CYPCA
MDSTVMVVLLWILLPSTTTGIKLDGNGYVDVIIAISSRVPQDDTLIDKIKEMVTEGSFSLYDALNKKVYFREVTILVPPQWNGTNFTKARTEQFQCEIQAKIRIDNANPAYGVEPYTNQYGECERSFIFLQHLYIYHEIGEVRKPFYHSNSHIEATRCSEKTGGQFFDVTAGGSLQPCRIDPQTSLPTKGCIFFPNRNQITNCSIMFSPSLDPVTAFCQKNKHNYEAQSMLNKKCGKATWTVIFEDSVDKDALQTLKPLESPPPPPSFKVVQRTQRVVCLILDVSGSMAGPRILQQRQAATHFLRYIIEDQASVGIVTFSTSASTLSNLMTIDSDITRENLIKLLPNVASGSTNMCLGLSRGDEIIFLTDGQATDNIAGCAPSAIQSGAIIHTLAFSNSAAHALTEMANKTGGIFLAPNDNIISNQLMDAFASLSLSTGDYTNKPVQLESVGARTSDWFNGTVSVDQTVGNKTSFVIIYEISLPSIFIQSPSGSIYTQTNMSNDDLYKTVTLKVLGTAEPGDWKYSIQTTSNQAFTITVTSQASHDVVPPIIVKTHMNQQFNDGTKPMTVFAEVSQNYRPVINAEVWATLESETGLTHTLQLLDNGAGADAFKDDGVYSRFFTKMLNGRSSLKVRVKNQDGQTRFAVTYVPGYVINGVVQLNPPKPPVSEEPLEVGNFTRTATGESFEVKLSGTTPLNFPPNRITDLSAEIQEDTVLLSWTAPGEDLDQGTAKSYEIRWSFDLDMLRSSFSNGHAVNTAGISPQKAGSDEKYSFNLSFPIQNCITVIFAVQSKDNQNATSETSNIAQASKIPPGPPGVSNPCINLIILVISVCVETMVICFIVLVTRRAVKLRKRFAERKVALTIANKFQINPYA